MVLAYDTTGSGHAIVFLHAALGDRRMWQPQWDRFGSTNRLVRVDLRGFGESLPTVEPFSRATEVVQVLDEIGIDRTIVVGASMGGRVALELAVRWPDRVSGVFLIGSARISHDWSQQVQDFWVVEEAALERGDLDAAVAANLDFWLDGPARSRAGLDEADRSLVAQMQRSTFENELAHPDAAREDRLLDLDSRLGEISVPVKVLYGEEDPVDIAEIARYIANHAPNASLHPIENAAHLPSLEQPAKCNELLSQLLSDVAVAAS